MFKKKLFLILLVLLGVFTTQAQEKTNDSSLNPNQQALELARASLKAHGGENFKNMRSLRIFGVDINESRKNQMLVVIDGEKYRAAINYDGERIADTLFDGKDAYSGGKSSARSRFDIPFTEIGLLLLRKIDVEGYKVSQRTDNLRGFRITTPEGFYTDFNLHPDNLISSYFAYYKSFDKNIIAYGTFGGFRNNGGIFLPTRAIFKWQCANERGAVSIGNIFDDTQFTFTTNSEIDPSWFKQLIRTPYKAKLSIYDAK